MLCCVSYYNLAFQFWKSGKQLCWSPKLATVSELLCLMSNWSIHSEVFIFFYFHDNIPLIAILQILFSAGKNSKNSKFQLWRELMHRQRRSLETEVTIQLLVVVDRGMINYHGNRSVEEYVLTVMNMVSESTGADLTNGSPQTTVCKIEILWLFSCNYRGHVKIYKFTFAMCTIVDKSEETKTSLITSEYNFKFLIYTATWISFIVTM